VALTGWFRRHQRHFLAGLVMLLMVTFGIPTASFVRRRGPRVGEIRGHTVHESDMLRARRALGVLTAVGSAPTGRAASLHLLDRTLPSMLSYAMWNPELRDIARALQGPVPMDRAQGLASLARFLWPDPERPDTRAAESRFLVFLWEAEAAGLTVTAGEVQDFYSFVSAASRLGLLNPRHADLLRQQGMSDVTIFKSSTELLSVLKLMSLRRDAIALSRAELWATWSWINERIRVKCVALSHELFLDKVAVDDEALRAFYDKHKDTVADADANVIGYKRPEVARVEFCLVPTDEMAEGVDVTDDEIRAYYEDPANKWDFLEALPKPAKDEEEAEAGEGEAVEKAQADDEERPGPVEQTQEPTADEPVQPDETDEVTDAQNAAEQDDVPEGYRRRSLEEVRDDIRKDLIDKKVAELARERIARAREMVEARAADYPGEPVPFERIALACGLERPRIARIGAREFLSADELGKVLPAASGVTGFVFDNTRGPGSVGYFDREDRPFIIQLLERRDAEMQPFEFVRAEVLDDFRPQEALRLACERAEKLKLAASAGGLAEALEELNVELGLEETDRLSVETSEMFRYRDAEIAGIPSSREMVEEAFDLDPDAYGVVSVPLPVGVCYVLQAVERTAAGREEFAESGARFRAAYATGKLMDELHAWMEDIYAEAWQGADGPGKSGGSKPADASAG